uniref:Uncharacterized protein n=1 Tax=Arundo donax TaxID=35708 RepID=A0A0A9HRY3_ARUDO
MIHSVSNSSIFLHDPRDLHQKRSEGDRILYNGVQSRHFYRNHGGHGALLISSCSEEESSCSSGPNPSTFPGACTCTTPCGPR